MDNSDDLARLRDCMVGRPEGGHATMTDEHVEDLSGSLVKHLGIQKSVAIAGIRAGEKMFENMLDRSREELIKLGANEDWDESTQVLMMALATHFVGFALASHFTNMSPEINGVVSIAGQIYNDLHPVREASHALH